MAALTFLDSDIGEHFLGHLRRYSSFSPSCFSLGMTQAIHDSCWQRREWGIEAGTSTLAQR
jgi:hypothetical protein